MRPLALAVLFLAGCAGAGASPNVVQVPIGPATAAPTSPLPTIDRFHVVATGQNLHLVPIEGAVLVTNYPAIARLGPTDVAEVFDGPANPVGSAQQPGIGFSLVGRWPDDVWAMTLANVGCRASTYAFHRLDGHAWKSDDTSKGVPTNGVPLEWLFRRSLARGGPKPTLPACADGPYVRDARAANGFLVAKASCGGKTRVVLWAPAQAEGTVLDWATPDDAAEGEIFVEAVGASSARDITIMARQSGRRQSLMHFDGERWSETPLPPVPRTEQLWFSRMSVAPLGTLWLIMHDKTADPSDVLWRRDAGKAWRTVDVGRDLHPEDVVARGEADVWVVAAAPRTSPEKTDRARFLLHGGAPPTRVVDLDHVNR